MTVGTLFLFSIVIYLCVPQTLGAEKNKHCVPLFLGISNLGKTGQSDFLTSNISWDCSHLKGFTRASKMSHSHGCVQEASAAHGCLGVLPTWAAGLLQSKMEATLSFMMEPQKSHFIIPMVFC